ncbi:MAG: YbhB/YbcL family Raf kinase inhibitor-like protein [Polyangiaceae bacterium]|nr:YbhB/YbcL family Raf kinase inhibitor-like protein [Polyangiaceae bacterium]
MTQVTFVDRAAVQSGTGGAGWLARALMLSLGCLLTHCGDDSTSSSLPSGTGGARTGTGGVTSSGGNSSGGATGSGGISVATGGSGGTSGSTTGGGTVSGGAGGSESGGASGPVQGGAGGSGSWLTGGASDPGGAGGLGGERPSGGTSTGGGSDPGGAGGPGGEHPSGGTATGGSGDGGARTGGNGSGGATTGGTSEGGTAAGGSGDGGTFTVTSPGWENVEGCTPDATMSCAPLPTAMTRASGGNGTSPELTWNGVPEGTQSFAVLLQDLANGTAHWILWNIPSTVTTLPANIDQTTATPAVPAGSQQCGKGDEASTSNGYYGPGAPCNVYELIVFALSIDGFSPTNATDEASVRTQLQALGDRILGTADLRGRTDTGC